METNLITRPDIDINNTNEKAIQTKWNKEHEDILIEWADKAMCLRWLHSKANNKFSKLSRWFTIPVIIISTLTGTGNFAQDRVPQDYTTYFVMIIGTLNIIAGIVSTIQQFLKINELNESHRVSSIAWGKFYRNIKVELSKNPVERTPVDQMLKIYKEEYDRLMETSPHIQGDIITSFNKTFIQSENFTAIKKPEICDDLVSTREFRFISKIKNDGLDINSEDKKQEEEYKTYKSKINDIINEFKIAQDRAPLRDEIDEMVDSNIVPNEKKDNIITEVLSDLQNIQIKE